MTLIIQEQEGREKETQIIGQPKLKFHLDIEGTSKQYENIT